MSYVTAEVLVDLNDFDDEDLVEHLEANGYVCTKDGSSTSTESIAGHELDHIDHLFICGQKQAAISEIFSVVGRAIGRQITH